MPYSASPFSVPWYGWGETYEAAASKLLYMNREGPNFQKLVQIIDKRWIAVIAVIMQIIAAFDIDTAQGQQLEIIGEWLGRRREGMTDERYRRALKVQRNVLLSSSGSAATLIQVWTEWVGSAPTTYRNIPPAEVEIGGVVPAEDQSLLVQFLQAALPAGVRLSAIGHTADFLICDIESAPLADPGKTDIESAPVTGAKPVAFEFTP